MQGPWTDFMFHTSYRTGYHVPYLTCNTGRLVCQAISESASVTMAAPMITPSHPMPTHNRLFMTHLHLVAHIWGICTKWPFGTLHLILSIIFCKEQTLSSQRCALSHLWDSIRACRLLCGNIMASTIHMAAATIFDCRHDFYFTSQAAQHGKLVRGSLGEEF